MPVDALPGTCCRPRLWLWPGQALYVGPSLELGPHSGAVPCLAVAVQGTFTVTVDGTSGPAARSALVAPRVVHQLVARSELMAFCYLDPGSAGHRGCRLAMTGVGGPVAYGHRHERVLAATAGELDDDEQLMSWLDLATERRPVHDPVDPRIRSVLDALHATDLQRPASADLMAALAGLSTSRFLHLFRDATGTSFRRYRTWQRMLCAADALRRGGDLTTAAADAGFASPSHLSDTVLAMFGLRPHHLLGTDIRVLSV